ncbi:MAG: FG-GAP-like repeat-containing protein [Candidatus Latescibacterota bacterium]
MFGRAAFLLAAATLSLSGAALGQTLFTEVTEQAFGERPARTRSTALLDYDNDGRLDAYLPYAYWPQVGLWHQEPDGRFVDHGPTAIQAEPPLIGKGGGCVYADYDNDGDLDLHVSVGVLGSAGAHPNLLLRNDRGTFRDVAAAAGMTDAQATDNAVWLDWDRDGYLDLYVGNLASGRTRNVLYRNKGDGTFALATASAGLDLPLNSQYGGSNGGMLAADFNDDGWPDLYLGVYEDRNRLFLNDGEGRFRDTTTDEIDDEGQAFGAAAGDVDNDGDLDIFQAAGGGAAASAQRSLLLLNLGEATFVDITESAGLGVLSGREAYGVALADVDNDGDLDLIALSSPAYLFLNNGDGSFADRSEESGLPAPLRTAASLGDYNADGYLDLLVGFLGQAPWQALGGLCRNTGGRNHWLRVELVGVRSNRSAIGSRLIATAGDLRQMREVLGGRGWEQDELAAHFGLGSRTRVDRLEIRWPSGQVDVLEGIPADQQIRVIEGQGTYHPVAATAYGFDLPDSVLAGGALTAQARVHPALFEADARIERVVADLSDLGGPAAVPLVDQGDGGYRLAPIAVQVSAPAGKRRVSVLVEQATSVGTAWTRLVTHVLVAPREDLPIFDDGPAPGWGEPVSPGTTLEARQQTTVSQGSSAMAVTSAGGFTVEQAAAVPVSIYGYASLRFSFHPGDAVMRDGGYLRVSLIPTALLFAEDAAWRNSYSARLLGSGSVEGVTLDMGRREWQEVEVPLGALRRPTTPALDAVDGLVLTGFRLAGTFYLDDIRLVAARPSQPGTAVLAEHTAALPRSFGLQPNYPNPFNGSTVIRFSLPARGPAELVVYNLAGQKVATLVLGERGAGTHAATWDGRDDEGQPLATGAYLCHLRAGGQAGGREQTRRLLLLR